MKNRLAILLAFAAIGWSSCWSASAADEPLAGRILLKTPGNPATAYDLHASTHDPELLQAACKLPVVIRRETVTEGSETRLTLTLTASQRIYYNIEQLYRTSLPHEECLFYMPGFWYHRNLRSPESAPSFHTSDSWQVREDRLSTPLTGIYDERSGDFFTVLRTDSLCEETLACHNYGEVILSGRTSLGFTGFRNVDGHAALVFGFPWSEAPKSYIRKLNLAPQVRSFEMLEKGESRRLTWVIRRGHCDTYSRFVADVWNDSFDRFDPQPLDPPYTPDEAKALLSEYFLQSYVGDYPLKYTSGVELRTDDPASNGVAEVGFVGRVLLNACNALEYGEATHNETLVNNARSIFDSYLRYGFTPGGLIREVVDFKRNRETDVYSIRRQSEGAYALLLYLAYEQEHDRRHPEWEKRVRTLLDRLLQLQNPDGSFPRKFRDNLSVVDASGGSTSSATQPLTMAAAYFHDKRFRQAACRTADYIEQNIIARADYFSSTLDANCEDKEAALYASTAMYYLAMSSRGEERSRYVALCREAAYFTLSWYYLWDVPFARGQMLGDVGFHSRGWGNVSVENNHIDVFIFEFATVLDWLGAECRDERFPRMSAVIRSSMLQLLPTETSHFDIGRAGYYPEVVQHTTWDYGRNGKGFYNDIFAPGWTVASLWQMLSPERVERFFATYSSAGE